MNALAKDVMTTQVVAVRHDTAPPILIRPDDTVACRVVPTGD